LSIASRQPESRPAPQSTAGALRPKLRVALCQIAPTLGDRDRNIDLHLAQIERARRERADLIVFPELSLTGYFLRDMVPDVALPANAPELDRLAKAAGNASLVLGFVEEAPHDRFYNSALYAEAGQIVHVHRKVFLPTYGLFDEKRYFAPGDRLRAFDTPRLGRVGLLVCEDLWHLSAIAVMQAEEIDFLICIANSPARGVEGPRVSTAETYDRLTRCYAETLGATVVLAHRVGFEDGLCFWGGSMVVGPSSEVLARAPYFDESLLVAEFDLADLRRQRLLSPLGRDTQLMMMIEELQRIKRRRYEH
jgi:predicted amidohydrolase